VDGRRRADRPTHRRITAPDLLALFGRFVTTLNMTREISAQS